MEDRKKEAARELLDQTHEWPCEYTFKFVVKTENRKDIEDLFPDCTIEEKASSGGKFTSLTIAKTVNSADEVLYIYDQASKIKGVLAL